MSGVIGFVVGFLVCALLSIGGADRIIELYAEKNRLYRIGEKAYEIKEVK